MDPHNSSTGESQPAMQKFLPAHIAATTIGLLMLHSVKLFEAAEGVCLIYCQEGE